MGSCELEENTEKLENAGGATSNRIRKLGKAITVKGNNEFYATDPATKQRKYEPEEIKNDTVTT